ncbi:hypothetical protein [Thalassospira lohafexi]|uniref:MalT-like TPR region domain-containing protein n=1 Tax=Thalassospira lohafexi TaxID=744227 RepID=A0A2N3L721_9PROT|nr:hypothetical protein [Thalassospira lohafexi]PKR58673.1 hypothetical protein COO92_07300 [Thalassospira lohafexi]
MQDKSDEYALRLSFIEATEPGSLTLARLYLEMATSQHHSKRDYALSLFDKADQLFASHLPKARDAAIAGLSLSLNNRAALELDAGQWEWAIDAASQAVALRRDRLNGCVGRKDDLERLDLGYSLAALVLAMRGAGQLDLARDAAGEAIRILGRFAGMNDQEAFVLLTKLICIYAELCDDTGQVPDAALLLPLAKAFYNSKGPQSDDAPL